MDQYFVRADGVKEKTIGPDLALYVEAQRSIHVLNATARFVWAALSEPMTFDELVFVLTDAFAADPDVLRADLQDTLKRFEDAGLVRTRTEAHGDALS